MKIVEIECHACLVEGRTGRWEKEEEEEDRGGYSGESSNMFRSNSCSCSIWIIINIRSGEEE